MNDYIPFNSYLLRIPLLSLNYIQSIYDKKETSLEVIKEIFKSFDIQEAIFLASPSLHGQLMKLLNNEIVDQKEIENLCYSITKYIMRMGCRCTPFGLFAGYSLGKLGEKTEIELNNIDKYYGHLRLDMNYLCALAIDLAKIPEIRSQLKFYPNTSIYKSGDKIRYVEYKYINSVRNHFVIAVDDSKYLQRILKGSENGLRINDLAKLLVNDEIRFEEVEQFIFELIDSQLLISELEPSVTGDEFLHQIINVLKKLEGIDHNIKFLEDIDNDINNIRTKSIGISEEYYLKIKEKLSKLETKFDIKYLFQTDLVVKGNKLKVDRDIPKIILEGIEVMNKLSLSTVNDNLTKFKEAFYERYEEREIPLLQALDVESGVGYLQNLGSGDLNPLIDNIVLPLKEVKLEAKISWNAIQSFLLKKYNESLSKKLTEVIITDDELEKFNASWDDLPSTFNAMVEVVKSNQDDEPIVCFSSAGGSSAANLLGRFCHSSDELLSFVKTITEKEKEIYSDSVLAEIVHLPESRTGNILLRPKLREYEIPYLAKSSVPKDRQIGLDDLMVSVNQGKRIVLRSKSLNKRVIPRLSNAHNFSYNALPVYQFLCDMQTQDLRGGIGFSWGAFANEHTYLPRVRYKNIILSVATWNLKKQDIESLINAKGDKNLEEEFKIWKEKFNLPDYVLLADGDNELLIYLNNLLCVKTFISLVKNRSLFKLKEFLFNTENSVVKRGDDVFTNQMVFSFYKDKK